jgi:hypothetical protein
LLVVVLTLGPPIVRLGRGPEVLFQDPFALSPGHWVHVGAWAIGGVAGLAIVGRRLWRALRRLLSWPVLPYTVWVALALLSVAYASLKPLTAFEAGRLAAGLLLAVSVSLVLADSRSRSLSLIEGACVLGVLTQLALMLSAPWLVGNIEGMTGAYRLTGGMFGDYGGFAVITGGMLLRRSAWPVERRSWVRYLYLLGYCVTWVVVALTRTRTALVAALIVAGVILYLLEVSRRLKVLWCSILGACMVVALGLQDAVVGFLLRGQTWEQVVGLTGRVAALEYMVDQWRQAPIFGFGYGSGSRFVLLEYVARTGTGMGQAHDVLSRALVDLGVAGTSALLIAIFAAVRATWGVVRLARRGLVDRSLAAGWAAVMAWQITYSFTGSGVAAPSLPFALALVTVSDWPRGRGAGPVPAPSASSERVLRQGWRHACQ